MGSVLAIRASWSEPPTRGRAGHDWGIMLVARSITSVTIARLVMAIAIAVFVAKGPAYATFAGHPGQFAYAISYFDASGQPTYPLAVDGVQVTFPTSGEI